MAGNANIFIGMVDVTFCSVGNSHSPPFRLLDGVTLSIRRGEFVALFGGSACGKTTLARLLNGLLLPNSGCVMIDGIDTREQGGRWEVRRRVGMLFQEPDNQIVGTTVAEDVAFGPENLGLASEIIQSKVRNALQAVGMSEYADQAPHLLSGIQKLKVSLAGVLALNPSCVVIDESTALLDPAERTEIMALLRRLNREDRLTVLLVTRLKEELCAADRAIMLHAGRVVSDVAVAGSVSPC
ncbi:MAG: ATP-binding cassette domain-containing protein [Deltaproteobacteria bacterium]|nr:ATP-binding cassette domain-containing protein [Deltaproteobacteria bacterium]